MSRMPLRQPFSVRRQTGMALLISLIVLLVVSMLGVVAMRSAMQQNRVSINNQVSSLAFQAAESGISAALAVARDQINLGPDGLPGTGDEIPVTDPAHIFNIAISQPQNPQRICILEDGGTRVVAGGGLRLPDGSISFNVDCPALPDSAARVTTVVSESPDGGELIEGFDVTAGAALTVQVRSQGDVPGTNIRSIHAEEWSRAGPASGID